MVVFFCVSQALIDDGKKDPQKVTQDESFW